MQGDNWAKPQGYLDFPGGTMVKNSPDYAGDKDLILGLGRSPGVVNGNPLQYFCLENSMDRGARQAPGPWGRRVNTTERLGTSTQGYLEVGDSNLEPGTGEYTQPYGYPQLLV